MIKKPSFFQRLTGSVEIEDSTDSEVSSEKNSWIEEDQGDGQLTVDVHHTATEIVVKTMVAGVKPEDLDINITRDMVTIKGSRETEKEVREEDYYHRELYWGSFSRSILLPCEVLPDEAEASEKHGLLTIRLPKVDKTRQTKLKVKSS